MPREHVFLNREIVPADEARLSVFDAGITHGAGLFETMRAYNGVPFQLDAHLERLTASARKLEVPIPSDLTPWRTAATALLEVNRLREARMRLTVTPGSVQPATASQASSEPRGGNDASFAGTVLITAARVPPTTPEAFERGMTIRISPYRQTAHDPLAGHKSVSYLPRLLGLREAQAVNCGEALWFTDDSRLAEACMSNVFLVTDETLLTPPLDTPVLPGITRRVVLELARDAGIQSDGRALTINDLLGAKEVFLTNSVMELMPVTRIERHAVGDEKPGPITRRLAELYRERVRRETGQA